LLAQAWERFPGDLRVLHDLARSAEARHDWAEAERRWQKYIELDPDLWWPYIDRARAVREQGRLDEAANLLIEAGDRFPRQPGFWHDLARLSEGRQDWTQAERGWQRFIAIEPNVWWAHTGLAVAQREQGRWGDVQATFATAQSVLPHEAALFMEPARFAERRGDWQGALDGWRLVNERFSYIPEGYLGQVHALREMRRQAESYDILVRALADPSVASNAIRRIFIDTCTKCEKVDTSILRDAVDALIHAPSEIDGMLIGQLSQLCDIMGDDKILSDHWDILVRSEIFQSDEIQSRFLRFYGDEPGPNREFVLTWMFDFSENALFARNPEAWFAAMADYSADNRMCAAWDGLSNVFETIRAHAPLLVRVFFDLLSDREISPDDFENFVLGVLERVKEFTFLRPFARL